MLRVVRRGDRHDPRDLTVSIRLEGDADAMFLEGRAGALVPGEAIKRFIYDVAREYTGEIEPFGLALCRRLLESQRQLTRVRAEIAERSWLRMDVGGKAQGQTFMLGGPEERTVAITSNGVQTAVVSGLDHLMLMRTSGFLDRRGTRADDGTDDAMQPLLVGSLGARWTYSNPDVTFGPYRQGVRAAVTETFAMHAAQSLQHTLYAIADVVLATYEEIVDVTLSMHERPYRPADPLRIDATTPDELFHAVEEPLGVVEITVERDQRPR